MADLISVIVATYNREDALAQVLRSLASQGERDFEILVADDGSRTATARVVTEWAGDPAAVIDYGGRWPRPVPVPNDGVGVELEIEAVVAEKLEAPNVRVSVSVRCAGSRVLTMPRTIVALS